MSSTYRVLCLSHDPAIVAADDFQRPEAAEAAIAEGIAEHADCDLVIGRYSYPLVELGCPTSKDQPDTLRPGVLRCYHGGIKWTEKDWLLLLAAAYQSDDPAMREAVKAGSHSCLPWERLRRLRLELDFTVKEQPEPVRGEDGRVVCTCTYDRRCGCGTSVLYEVKEQPGA